MQERCEQVVDGLKCRRGRMVDGARGGFRDWQDVGLDLVCERGRRVVGCRAEECFEFRARFGRDLVDCVVHGEFVVDAWSKKSEGGAVAVVGVEDGELFFRGVKGDVVSCSPVVDTSLAVVELNVDFVVWGRGVEAFENRKVVGILGVTESGVAQWGVDVFETDVLRRPSLHELKVPTFCSTTILIHITQFLQFGSTTTLLP